MEHITTNELIMELERRGYRTSLLFCEDDVDMNFKLISEEIEIPNTMNPSYLYDVLDDLSLDWHCESLNDELYERVYDRIMDEISCQK